MGFWVYSSVSLVACVLVIGFLQQANASECDFFQGNWVNDESYPIYDPATCPFIQREFNCLKNGRPDLMYLKYRWQPHGCDLARWDYIQVGKQIYKDMDRTEAFEKALTTWAGWVDSTIDPTKSTVFFQGISPSHYNGTLWNEPSAKTCKGQTQPLLGSTYPGGLPPPLAVLKEVLSKITKPLHLLDITNLSLLRKDGHPSIYGLGGPSGMDCSHWCLAGVPDTWNLIFYNLIL
ncbi:hypothetical protein L1049_001080 [Liquidambar formosana]|uniref:Trichome birefringence-like C-terminal domain-containing protein n=1 Tax=Liquidambar formosana TaxID=63359 RepID=A0AAP0R5X3_LIQFO